MGTVPTGRDTGNRPGARAAGMAPPFHPPARPPIFTPIADLDRTDTIDDLTSRQRAQLRALAHPLKPILHVGAEGVSDAVLRSTQEAFNTRELLKVKVLENAPLDLTGAAAAIRAALPDTRVPLTIGRILVLYRPFPGHPEIQLVE